MKIISTKVHGVLDYLMGIALIAAPWILGFAVNGFQLWIPLLLGVSTIVYSLMTDYELGLSDNISMRTHLIVDFISGLLLAASPWIFGFADEIYLPHVILGGVELIAVLFTTTKVGGHAKLKTPQITIGERRHPAHG